MIYASAKISQGFYLSVEGDTIYAKYDEIFPCEIRTGFGQGIRFQRYVTGLRIIIVS